MNLLQSQDALKGETLDMLRARKSGQIPPNPDTPMWLVDAVLAEKIDRLKKEELANGSAQGALPSITEQINQKAGLMALQGQQQQQAQQQMMQQMAQAPQPAPENVPQPEPQPEPQMMAEGGLARLPVDSRMFDYREGGIISFQSQGAVPEADPSANFAAIKAQAEQAIANLRTYGTIKQQQDPEGYQQAIQAAKAAAQAVQEASKQADRAAYNANPPYIASQKPFRNFTPPVVKKVEPQNPGAVTSPSQPPAALPAALPQRPGQTRLDMAPPPAAPRPRVAPPAQPPQAAAPQAPTQEPAQAAQPAAGIATLPVAQTPIEMAKAASEAFPMARKEPSIQGTLDTQEAFRTAAGAMAAGEPQRQQLEAYRAESERIRKEREKSDAIAALSGYGGLAELAQRSAVISQRNILADTIRNDAAAAMQAAMEGMKQAQATGNVAAYNAEKEKYISAQDARANASITATNELTKQRMQSATQERGQDMQKEMEGQRISSSEKVAQLDRNLRIKLNNTPPAQRATVEENAILDYMKTLGISYSQAYEKVKLLGTSAKGQMTPDQAADNVGKFLESTSGMQYVSRLQKEAKDAGKPVPDIYAIRKELIKKELGSQASTEPTMTAAQAAALAKYPGAK